MSQHQPYSSVDVVGDDDVVRGGVCKFVKSDYAVLESQYGYYHTRAQCGGFHFG